MIIKRSLRFGESHIFAVSAENIIRACFVSVLFFCISCASLNFSSGEEKTIKASGKPAQEGLSLPPQCSRLISAGVYVVQAGAFKHILNAQALRNSLDESGYGGFITVSGLDEDKRIFRVLIGQFNDVKAAQMLSEEIKARMKIDVFVELKPPKDKFVVQAGCFKEMAEARACRQALADKGHNAYIILSGTGTDKQYNVLLGEYLDKAEAERVSEEIRQKENIAVFVNVI